jgi:CRISPR-associated exonuclease Cas4
VSEPVTFGDLALAAYCPRKLDYAERSERGPPPRAERVKALADEYADLRDAPGDALRERPVAVGAGEYRYRLERLAEREVWGLLVEPAERNVLLSGKDCRGYAAKVGTEPAVTLVSAGEPPENGVWKPQGVKAVAAAKALAWREGESVERVFVEYPAHAVVRSVSLTTRRKAAYRTALRAVRERAPRPRCANGSKCESCEFEGECGAGSRSLRSLLFG